MQIPGVIHVHTTFSSGIYSLEELVQKAGEKGIEVLVLTDHDLLVMEYGIFPLRNIIKKREERRSILSLGPENYLLAISDMNKRRKNVLVIPGAQSSPFYYWTGSPFQKNLTAHDYRKELLLIGMKDPDDYRNLPVMHRGFSTQYLKTYLPQSIIFLLSFFFAGYLIFQKGLLRWIGIFVSVFSLLLLIDHHPFQSSRFSPYHGDQGIAPFQEMIDYVRERKGLVFWAHPESKYAQEGVPLGPVKLKTRPYPDALLDSINYTGFSAIYGDESTAVDPGKHWDEALNDFCLDKRERPPWAIAGSDFHVEQAGVELDTFQTVFWVKQKEAAEVMESLAKGRMYAVQKGRKTRLRLDRFEVRDKQTGTSARSGSGLKLNSTPIIEINLAALDNSRYPIEVTVNRGGKIVTVFKGETPFAASYEDTSRIGNKTFYRIDARSAVAGRVISNPIFVLAERPAN